MSTAPVFVDPEDESWGHHTLRDAEGHRVHLTRGGTGPAVVCLHGWPGGWFDYRLLRPLLEPVADVVLPDLRGFGGSDRPALPVAGYSRAAQAAVVLAVLDALGIERAVLVGYDIGSSIAIQVARDAPDRVVGLALGNPMNPAAGPLLLAPEHRGEFWYQDFHQLELASALIDGEPRAVAAYLGHFYRHWGGRQEPLGPAHLAALVRAYAEPGAFTASLNWYRSGSSSLPVAVAAARGDAPPAPPVGVPSAVVWGAADPLFPPAFSEGLEAMLPGHRLTVLEDVGHFVPLEAPGELAAAVRSLLPGG
ncbi:alpha/beta fold hydrolase [Pseudonocardia humida]|uniref:Alpha/beta hydrolase n=1 Tax=Pseudonocardia humida TaxID=2800819 RepID=A0ABT1A5W8_9PSEU|nr:alpha/beta hydrolase [Pseudonocardia humida]MCO1658370.1 alpha/beta hydrolase [Pseudonocardia humida]